jgi:hypothetical protein
MLEHHMFPESQQSERVGKLTEIQKQENLKYWVSKAATSAFWGMFERMEGAACLTIITQPDR